MIDFDVILSKIGGLGRYQIFLILVVAYSSLPAGYNSLAPVFLNLTPNYRCEVPEAANCTKNLDEPEILNLTTPWIDEEYVTCKRYRYKNQTDCDESCDCFDRESDPVPCDKGYYYDTTLVSPSVITEFDLICERAYLDSLATVLFMIGILLGSLIFGNVCDRVGRRTTMIICATMSFLALLGCVFTHNFWLFVTCRMSVAFFGSGIYLANFVYILEITSSKWRTLIGIGFQIGFAIGYMILSGFAYQWRDWHQLQFVMAIFSLPYALSLFAVPESPRWLFSNNNVDPAKEITRKIAKYNGVVLDEEIIWEEAEQSGKQKKSEASKESRTYSTLDLFRTSRMRIVTLMIMFNWFVNGLVYYGISLNVGSLNGDIFVNNALNGVMEIGAYVIVIALVDKIGRRAMLISMMTEAGLSLICGTIVNEYSGSNVDLQNLGVAFALMAKIGISGSYGLIYNFTSELVPTVVRSNGIAVGSISSRIGSIIAPILLATQSYETWLPNTIFGVLSIIGAALSFFFPETRGIDMIQSIEDAEAFYARQKRSRSTSGTEEMSHSNTMFSSSQSPDDMERL